MRREVSEAGASSATVGRRAGGREFWRGTCGSSGIPPGCGVIGGRGSGGVAALNRRLMAVNPPGSELGAVGA